MARRASGADIIDRHRSSTLMPLQDGATAAPGRKSVLPCFGRLRSTDHLQACSANLSLEPALESFKTDTAYWEEPSKEHQKKVDRDTQTLIYASAKGAGRKAMAPAQLTNQEVIWGGGLCRMATGGVGPRREDNYYCAPRYTPAARACQTFAVCEEPRSAFVRKGRRRASHSVPT
ncbi:hypothetical protein ElyMa_002540100 [Elysia marginata]|uniref:Uncharacterized protein n=1 Tax=Elysia marginata TaxID=1093978 RepID=A0AAV4GY61_9GAST|nr:hypothetical protein ElyMa_002540100 [Elysia marginata]